MAVVAALALGILAPHAANAQAAATETRSADILVFGGYNYTSPDYGLGNQHNHGLFYGGAFQRYFVYRSIPLAVGLEVRGTHTTGPVVAESTFSGGFRVATTLKHRYNPYINFEVGQGNINYNVDPVPGYSHDNGLLYDFGGGIDIDIYRRFGLRIDGQSQSWNLGKNYTLSPSTVSVGIVYRIPFHPWLDAGHERQ